MACAAAALALALLAVPLVEAVQLNVTGSQDSPLKSRRSAAHPKKPAQEPAASLVVPGDWLSDKASKFLFLPMTVPKAISLQQCKVLCNGDSLLIVVTEQPQDEPEDDALRKYKLVVDALKSEVGHDESRLKEKLEDWLDTEEDEEVRVRVQAALSSLSKVRAAKHDNSPRTVAVPLGAPTFFQQAAVPSSVRRLRGGIASATEVHNSSLHGLPASAALRTLVAQSGRGTRVRRRVADGAGARANRTGGSHATGIIKESFTVDIPYPAPPDQVFAVQVRKGQLMVGMPWLKRSLEAKGVSTGGRPFARVPVFDAKGRHLAGPSADLKRLIHGMDAHLLFAKRDLDALMLPAKR